MPPPPGTIQHLVVLMLENRSFDHMFGFLKSDDYPIDGLTGQESNLDSEGAAVAVSNDAMYSGDFNPDPGHHFPDVTMQIFGNQDGTGAPNMGGFVQAYGQMGGSSVSQSHKIMRCYAPSKIPIITTLAQEYAICQRWFSAAPGPTLPNRSYAHAATSMGRLDMNPLWYGESKTIYELLGESNVSSKIFFHDSTVAMTFKNFVKNQKWFAQFDDFLDMCNSNKLPAYSFIEPRYNADDTNDLAANDQHPDHDVSEGETLIQDVFHAISRKPAVWNSTILLVVYDEHGGLYDHVPPPSGVPNPDDQNSTDPPFDFTRLGVRVPAVVISPWIDPLTIDSTQYDHTSIAATARKLFLGADWQQKFLTKRDQAANTFDGLLTRDTARQDTPDFHQPPNLEALARARDPQFIAQRAAQQAALPLSELQMAMVQQTHAINQTLPPSQQSSTRPEDIQTQGQAAAFHNEVMSQVLAPQAQGATP